MASSSGGWYTPKRLLALFCVLNTLNYVERAAVSTNGVNGQYKNETCADDCDDYDSHACRRLCDYTGIQGEFDLSNADNGLLATVFTIGLCIMSPISAHAVKVWHPFRVIAVGQLIFTLGLVAAGFAPNFGALLAARAVVGAAEPSFLVVAPAYINAAAPPRARARWLACLFATVSFGNALGYQLGAALQNTDWRWSFRAQAMLNAPFIFFFFLARPVPLTPPAGEGASLLPAGGAGAGRGGSGPGKEEKEEVAMGPAGGGDAGEPPHRREPAAAAPPRDAARLSLCSQLSGHSLLTAEAPPRKGGGGAAESGGGGAVTQSLRADFAALSGNCSYLLLVVGVTFYQADTMATAFWGAKAAFAAYRIDGLDAIWGVMIAVAGITGSAVGGTLLDRAGAKAERAAAMCAVAIASGAGLKVLAWWLPPRDPSFAAFLPIWGIHLVPIFSIVPLQAFAVLNVTPPHLHPLAIAMSSVAKDAIGQAPSSTYYGAVQDSFDDWRLTFTVLPPALLVPASAAFVAGAVAIRRAAAAPAPAPAPPAEARGEEPGGRAAPCDVPSPRVGGAV